MGKTKKHAGQKFDKQGNQYTAGKVVAQIGNPTPVTPSRKYKARPAKPEYITGAAFEFWKRYATAYYESGRLNKDTMTLFCQLCEAWGRWRGFVDMRNELVKENPSGRGLIMRDGASRTVKPNGDVIERGGTIKVSIPADRAEKAEAHFSKQFEKFIDISDRMVERKADFDPFEGR